MLQLLVITSIIITFTINCIIAQNLVLNPSFEIISSCPNYSSQVPKAIPWTQPTLATPDLFNSCSNSIVASAPNNLFGYQSAHTGEGYVGMITRTNGFNYYREYVQGELASPLVAGQNYTIGFWISLADDVDYGASNMGLFLLDTMMGPNLPTGTPLSLMPQLRNTTLPLNNTSTWEKLEWSYTAVGGERFFIIGNFDNDSLTTIFPNKPSSFSEYAYYFIDDVFASVDCGDLAQLDSLHPTCPNTAFGSIQLDVFNSLSPHTFTWSNGATTKDISGLTPGTYMVTVSNLAGCVQLDTFVITTINNAPSSLNAYINSIGLQQLTIQEGDTVLLNSGINFSIIQYTWTAYNNNGLVFNFANPTTAQTFGWASKNGLYEIILTGTTSAGCSVSTSMQLTVQGNFEGMPNAFSPNGDGANDDFKPLGLNSEDILEFKIFNRWGQVVYDNTNLYSGGWDGTYLGVEQPSEVYLYLLRYKLVDLKEKVIRGECTLLR